MKRPAARFAGMLGLVALVAASSVAAPSLAHAQHSGGSFGGSSFGGGGGGGGSSHSSGGSSGGGSSYSGSSHDSGGGGGEPVGPVQTLLIIVILGAWSIRLFFRNLEFKERRDRARFASGAAQSGPLTGDVSAIRIAIDHRARPFLQARLDELARSGVAATPGGRAQALHEVCTELRKNQASWLFAHVENSPVSAVSQIQSRYQTMAAEARSRFRVETVRSGDGVLRTEVDEKTHDRGEGPGLVVITVVVAARREIADITTPDDARALRRLLLDFGALSASVLMGLEVIWSPSTEDDRLTEDELRRLYPELRPIRDETNEERVLCDYCRSPFQRSHPRCPHCGASKADSRPLAPSRIA